jgi:deoxyribonuclease V
MEPTRKSNAIRIAMSRPPLEIPDLPLLLRQLIAQTPLGRVTTCGSLAAALGNPIAALWIGHFLLHHAHDATCCCHRVVRAGGLLGGYIDGDAAKRRRLTDEGVEVADDGVDLGRHAYDGFASDRPLERLRLIQESLAAKVTLRPPRQTPRLVGGVDVSYRQPDEGVAAYALVDLDSGQLLWSHTVRRRVGFPYITSYLTFRELPILLELLDEVQAAGQAAPLLLVDGSGIMHHRHAGIASHLGVVAARPTIGVTKKLLFGKADIGQMAPLESRPVTDEGRPIGTALRPTAGSRRPIFISPGHRVSVAFAEDIVRRLLLGHRLPEPLYWADRLSRAAARKP